MEKNITFNIYQSDASSPVDLSFNFDFIPKKIAYRTIISNNTFGDIIFEVDNAKTKDKVVNFGGRLYYLNRIFVTKNIQYDSGEDTFVVIETVDDYNDKLRILLPATEMDDNKNVSNDLKEFNKMFEEAKNETKVRKKIALNGFISPRLFSYHEDENMKYIIYDESAIQLNTSKQTLLKKSDLNSIEVSGDEIKVSSSVGMNKATSDIQLFDDIYIDCSPIDNPSINNQIVKPKELYSIRPLFNTKDLGINSKFFIMLFISVIVCVLCFYALPNIVSSVPSLITNGLDFVYGNSVNFKTKNNSDKTKILSICAYIVLLGSFLLATYQLSKRSFGTSYRKYKKNIDISSGIFGGLLAIFYFVYLGQKINRIRKITLVEKQKKEMIQLTINILIPIGVIFAITLGVTRLFLPEMLVPKITEIVFYSLFLYAIYFVLQNMLEKSHESEIGSDGGEGGGGGGGAGGGGGGGGGGGTHSPLTDPTIT